MSARSKITLNLRVVAAESLAPAHLRKVAVADDLAVLAPRSRARARNSAARPVSISPRSDAFFNDGPQAAARLSRQRRPARRKDPAE